MARLDTSTLTFTEAHKDCEYDPHLQEEKLRALEDAHAPTITTKIDGKCYVDVLARLKKAGAEVPGLEIFGAPEDGPDDREIVTGRVAVADIEKVRPYVESLKAATELHLCLYNSVPAIRCDPKCLDMAAEAQDGTSFLGLDGSGVIIGVVDTGCDFRHGNFRRGNATRIRYLWDQNAEPKDRAPKEFKYGRELTANDIDKALRAGDEKAYEELGYTPPIAAHGTHVLDIAAGNGREPAFFGGKREPASASPSHPGVAPNASIIFVQLKNFDGTLGTSRYLVEAVEYIFRKADELKMPAVVNVSLSTTGGPHDGTTLVEQKLDELLGKRGRAIVVAAGNSFNQRSHAGGTVPAGGKATILWRTDPRNTDPVWSKNEMEVWYRGDQILGMTLATPDGYEVGSVALGQTKKLVDGAGVRYGRVSHRKDDPNNNDNQIDVRLPHLENDPRPWRITLTNAGDADVPYHAWIEQDNRGQSYFEEPTDRLYTLGSISSGRKTLTVGAFDTAERACLAFPYEATSAGPTRPSRRGAEPSREKPDLSAPGVNIVAARSHGGVIVMSGTSMAAAHVTGVVALLFELAQRRGGEPPSAEEIGDLLRETARRQPWEAQLAADAAPTERTRRLGAGAVDGLGAIKKLLASETSSRDQVADEQVAPARQSAASTAAVEDALEKLSEKMSRELSKISKKLDKLGKKQTGTASDLRTKSNGMGNKTKIMPHLRPRTPGERAEGRR